jgi:hypothetical protein
MYVTGAFNLRWLKRAAFIVIIISGLLVPIASSANAAANSDRLIASANEQLNPNQHLISLNGWYVLIMQQDGNLVEYASGNRAVWASNTFHQGSIVRMQADGNLVIIAPGNVPVWATATNGTPGADLELQNDGNIVLYGQDHIARWSSGVPRVPAHPYPITFNTSAAAAWASNNVKNVAPDQAKGDPCAQYVSRSLNAGGLPVDINGGWYPSASPIYVYMDGFMNFPSGESPQWYNVQSLRQYLLSRGWVTQYLIYPGSDVYPVAPGDIIYYEWNGQATADHVHVALVTRVANGTIYVADQNGTSNIGSNRQWDISGAAKTTGDSLISMNPNMKAYVLHWK